MKSTHGALCGLGFQSLLDCLGFSLVQFSGVFLPLLKLKCLRCRLTLSGCWKGINCHRCTDVAIETLCVAFCSAIQGKSFTTDNGLFLSLSRCQSATERCIYPLVTENTTGKVCLDFSQMLPSEQGASADWLVYKLNSKRFQVSISHRVIYKN